MQIGFEHFLIGFVVAVMIVVFYAWTTFVPPQCLPGEVLVTTAARSVVCVIGRAP